MKTHRQAFRREFLASVAVAIGILVICYFAIKSGDKWLAEEAAEAEAKLDRTYAAWSKAYPHVKISRDEWDHLRIYGLLPKYVNEKAPNEN